MGCKYMMAINCWLQPTAQGEYTVTLTSGLWYILTPKKVGYIFSPEWLVIQPTSNSDARVIWGYVEPKVVAIDVTQGTIYSPTPTYTWVGPMDAESYVLRVTDSVDSSKVCRNIYYSGNRSRLCFGFGELLRDANCKPCRWELLLENALFVAFRRRKICGAFSSRMNFIVSGGLPVHHADISRGDDLYFLHRLTNGSRFRTLHDGADDW